MELVLVSVRWHCRLKRFVKLIISVTFRLFPRATDYGTWKEERGRESNNDALQVCFYFDGTRIEFKLSSEEQKIIVVYFDVNNRPKTFIPVLCLAKEGRYSLLLSRTGHSYAVRSWNPDFTIVSRTRNFECSCLSILLSFHSLTFLDSFYDFSKRRKRRTRVQFCCSFS